MAWKITLINGTEVYADDKVRTPDGVVHPSTVTPGSMICMFPDGYMAVMVQSVEEV